MIKNYFPVGSFVKIAFRSIWKNKVFSAVNIIGLALSMACCLIISMYIYTELQFDTFHKNLNNVYRITEKQDQAGSFYNVAVTPGPLAPALQKDFPEIVNTVRFGNWSGILKNDNHVYEEKNIQFTDNSIFNVFNFPLLKGNPNTALLSPDAIVITEKIAEKYFGKDWEKKEDLLRQVFTLSNQGDFKLTGIAKNIPANSSINFDILLPLPFLFKTDEWSNKWNSNNYHTYLQLKAGTDLVLFSKKIENRLSFYNPETKDAMSLQPLKEQYLRSVFDFKTDWGKRSNIKYIKIFTGVGLLLLIIACVNFINLSTARSLKRSMEVGIRKVNGATRRQLVFQFLNESVLMAFIAGLLAVLIISVAQPILQKITGSDFNSGLSQPIFVTFFLLFIAIVGILAGLYPAIMLSSFSPMRMLKKTGNLKSGKLFRQGLVIIQFIISATLITCTFFMYRQFQFISQKDLGFDKEQLVIIRLGGQLSGKSGLFKNDLAAIPGVAGIGPATMSLVNVDNSSYFEWDEMKPDNKFLITQANIDPDFIPTLGLQLIGGKNFSQQLTNDTANYILNESAVKRMGYTINGALGKKATFWGAKGNIIGVVKDFHFKPLSAGIEPFIFRYQPQDRYFNLFVKIVPGKSKEILEQAERIYKKYESEAPFEFTFISDSINESYRDDKRTGTIILLFAGLTIFVGCLGLFGLTAFSAEQRIKEIGIRKVLGAGIASVTVLLSRDFLKLIIIAILVAVPAAWYITSRWLENYAYRINIEWWVFVLVGFIVTSIALFTISFQAIKAAVANPVKSLRTE